MECLTSAERGDNLCGSGITWSMQYAIPPFFVFPRVHYKEHFIRSAPPGSNGTAHRSGWMTDAYFAKFLHHFVEHVKPGNLKKILFYYSWITTCPICQLMS